MGAAEQKSQNAKYIKQPIRKAIKTMAYMSQIANCVNLMPTPEDFATQVIGEVTVLMGKIKDFTVRINDIMDTYTNFPSDFLAETTNNIMGTLTNYANVATNATQQMVGALHTAVDDIDYIATSSVGMINDAVAGTNTATRYLGDEADAANNKLNDVSGVIDDAVGKVDEMNETVKNKVQSAIDYINEKMQKVNDKLNEAFGDYILSDLQRNTTTTELDKISESMNNGSMGGALASSVTDTVSSIAKNFNIGKIATGFAGLATNIGLVAAGIDKLPELNLDNVLAFGRAKVEERHQIMADNVRDFKESDEYKRMVEDAEGDKKKLRAQLRQKRKDSAKERRRDIQTLTKEEREARRSVAKDIRKAKLQAKKAKMAQKFKEIIMIELDRFKEDLKMFGTNIKDEWTMMQDQYKEAVAQIKHFFTGDPNEAPGSKYIDDCCDAIEVDCDSIKETLQNLSTTITVSVSQVPAPTSVGQCFDNPLYKVLRWFECVKVIFNEIRRVINFGIDIIKQVDNIVKIILNGINSLKEIKEKLMEMLNIKWLLDFIDSIIELFMGKCLEGKELIENTISPVYYNETDEYDEKMEELSDAEVDKITFNGKEYETEDEETVEKLEEAGEEIIAYKSPILNEDGTDFKGWIFYHGNVDSLYSTKFKKNFARWIMKRAAKTGHRKKGGVNKLKNRNIPKVDGRKYNAYNAYYWYTKWTNDPNDDNLDRTEEEYDNNSDYISPVMKTENGTLVELEDGRRVFVNDFGIKSGDYVLVEGKRYRVR